MTPDMPFLTTALIIAFAIGLGAGGLLYAFITRARRRAHARAADDLWNLRVRSGELLRWMAGHGAVIDCLNWLWGTDHEHLDITMLRAVIRERGGLDVMTGKPIAKPQRVEAP